MAKIGRQLGGGGAATLEKTGMDTSQQISVSSPKLADNGGGGMPPGGIKNGGGGGDGDEGDDDAPLSSEETARLDAEAAEFASDWAAELSAAAWTDASEAPEGDRSSDEASQVRERESNDPVTEPVTDARRKGARATRRKRATPPPRVLT
jgi:hypothetical protein